MALDNFGIEGQKKMRNISVFCIGAGGLGCVILPYLMGLGLKKIGIIDSDKVDFSNLSRQTLYTEKELEQSKVEVLARRLKEMNSEVEIKIYSENFCFENRELVKDYDIIVDCTDNFSAQSEIHLAGYDFEKPSVYSSVLGYQGHISTFLPHKSPCYHCLSPLLSSFSSQTGVCTQRGVLSPLLGVLGSLQVIEVVKLILGQKTLAGKLLNYDAGTHRFSTLALSKDPQCFVCSKNEKRESFEISLKEEISSQSLFQKIQAQEDFSLVDVRTPNEHKEFALENSILIPLGDLPNHTEIFFQEKFYIIYCHSGIRSAKACQYLRNFGIKNIANLKGGIKEWLKIYKNSYISKDSC